MTTFRSMPPSASTSDGDRGIPPATERWLLAFVRLWAIAHITHLSIVNHQQLASPWSVITFAAAIVLIVRPASARAFTVMLCAQLVDMAWEMPYSPDHWMLVGFVNLAILLAMLRRRTWGLEALSAALPAARIIVLVAYVAAATAKYNWTFLDPVDSCATAMARAGSFGLTEALNAGPLWLLGTLAFETMIPILLLIPQTRRHGVRIALFFHLMLTVSPVIAVEDFSATLYALFFLFLSDEDSGRILDKLRGWGERSAMVRDARRAPWVTGALAFVALGLAGYLSTRVSLAIQAVLTTGFLVAVLLAALATWRVARGTRRFGTPLLIQVPVIVAIAMWAASPYLGFRTTGVFTMFSSLQTEGTSSNHLFWPTHHLTDWQDDLVVIESTNDPALEELGDGHLAIPLLELRRAAMDDPDFEATGTLHGERVVFGNGEGETELQPLSYWEKKVLLFRAISVDGEAYCSIS